MEIDINYIINSFKEKDIIIATICQNKNYLTYDFVKGNDVEIITEGEKGEEKYIKFNLKASLKQPHSLELEEVKEIFTIIKKELNQFNDKTVLIIFNEFFFSRKPLLPETNETFRDNTFTLFLLNFLYKLDYKLNDNEIKNLNNYLNVHQIFFILILI